MNCEIRPNVCGPTPCISSGVCVEDYRDNTFMCICNKAYDVVDTFITANNIQWIQALRGLYKGLSISYYIIHEMINM